MVSILVAPAIVRNEAIPQNCALGKAQGSRGTAVKDDPWGHDVIQLRVRVRVRGKVRVRVRPLGSRWNHKVIQLLCRLRT